MTTTTAPFRSILFDGRPEGAEGADPSIFADLNLDQVFAAVTAGRDEYDLMPFFSTPLHDLQTLRACPRATARTCTRRCSVLRTIKRGCEEGSWT